MNKKEFLDILYEQLSGQMLEGNVAAHVQYYRNYIEEEQRKGRSEDDILNELGDPHLIARTLLDTEAAASGNPQTTEYYSESYNGHSSGYNGYENFDSGHGKVKQLPSGSDDMVRQTGCHTDCSCCDHPSVHSLKCLNSNYDRRRCDPVCTSSA